MDQAKGVAEECLLGYSGRRGPWQGKGSIDAPTKGNRKRGRWECVRWRGIYGGGRGWRHYGSLRKGEIRKGFTFGNVNEDDIQ